MHRASIFERWTGIAGTPDNNPLRRAGQACIGPLKIIGLFSFCVNLLLLAVPLYMLQVYDRVLPTGSIETLWYLTLIAFVVLACLALFEAVRGHMLLNLGEWLEASLSRTLFARMIEGSLAATGYRGEALRDLSALRSFISGQAVIVMLDAFWVPVFIGVTFMMHPVLGVVALISAAVLFMLVYIDDVTTRDPLKRANESSFVAAGAAQAAARNAELIESMGMTSDVAGRWFSKNREALVHARDAGMRSKNIMSISRFARLLVQVVLLGVGGWLAVHQEITGGVMVAAMIIVSRALAPVEQAITVWRQLLAVRFSIQRLNGNFMSPSQAQASIVLPAPIGQLGVKGLFFAPPGADKPVLRNINFDLEAGETLAVIGASGSGKSTLARILAGIHRPSAGDVRLDGADVHSWPRADFGRYLGYLPQVVQLLPGSVRDNIARMGDGDDAGVIAAAKLAGVHELILHLPNGYDTQIGDMSRMLSGGQQQRVALALALYGEPRFVILDEPNANLDTAGDEALARALLVLKQRRTTVILITHRNHLVNLADKILLMREGVVDMFGTRQHVLERMARNRGAVAPAPVSNSTVQVVSSQP